MTDSCKIKTNWQPRNVIYWHELTDKEKEEFNYLDSEDEQESAAFFRYKGWTYDLGEFMRIGPTRLTGWEKFDGYLSDSFFSGILVRYVDHHAEQVIAATYYC